MALQGCSADDLGDDDDDDDLPFENALLEIYALDIWTQPLLVEETALTVWRDGELAAYEGFPVAQISLDQAATYDVTLDAWNHQPLTAEVAFDGSGYATGLTAGLTSGAGQGLTVQHDGSGDTMTHRVYLGLRHKWFSTQGRPARRGNAIELYTAGEAAYQSVHDQLGTASKSVLASTWWWDSTFELIRNLSDHHTLTPAERWPNTILGTMEQCPAEKRVIVGQFWGQDSILSWMTTDAELEAYAETPEDGFQIMGQGNPTEGQFFFEPSPVLFGDRVRATFGSAGDFADEAPIPSNVPGHDVDLTQWPVELEVQHASYHQKFFVIDGQVAFVGGSNLRKVDWDTPTHDVYEHRRMLFDATTEERAAVMNKEVLPDMGPRKDYMLRLEGPAVQDVADVFQDRWDLLLDQGVDYAVHNTPFEVWRDIAPVAAGSQIQITTTMPQPSWEHGIAESWFNAVDQAEQFIFIENQYFRIPMLHERIYARMHEVPSLKLVVITKPIAEWTDPGCAPTYKANQLFENAFPSSRYLPLQLMVFDTVQTWGIDETESRYGNMDTHSKLLIVDDLFLSVGSANANNRGIVYEGEMNVAVFDPDWVRTQRRRILTEILPTTVTVSDDPSTWMQQLVSAAAHNDSVHQAWEDEGWDINLNEDPLPAAYAPQGFVYALAFGNVGDCVFESVGPDMVGIDPDL